MEAGEAGGEILLYKEELFLEFGAGCLTEIEFCCVVVGVEFHRIGVVFGREGVGRCGEGGGGGGVG